MLAWGFLLALCGATLGAFAATAALRLQQGQTSFWGRSRCDACGAPLSWAATAPILAYIWRRGRTRCCDAPIDPLHLAGEGLGALVVLTPFWLMPPERAAIVALLGVVLLGASLIDLKVLRIPDLLSFGVAILCLVLAILEDRWTQGLIAAVLTYGILKGVQRLASRGKDRPSLGSGDIKLLSAAALWLGVWTSYAVLVAAVLGLAVQFGIRRGPKSPLPFGPMISLGCLVVGDLREGVLSSWF